MSRLAKCETVAALLDRAALQRGEGNGIYWNDRLLSYEALAQDSRKIARGIVAHGIGSGDHVALWSPNTPGFISALFACARIGAAVMIVNTKLSGAEVADIVRRSDAKALFYFPDHPDSSFVERLRSVEGDALGRLKLIIELDNTGDVKPVHDRTVISLDDLRHEQPLTDILAAPDAPALLYSTSGSTGPSKLVLHTNRTLATHAGDVAVAFGSFESGTVHLIPMPLAGAYGMTQLLSAIASYKPIVLQEKFEPEATARALQEYRVTHIYVLDDIVQKLFKVCGEERPFPALRSCAYAAFNAGYPDFERECERRGVPIIGIYGSSEMQALYVIQKLTAPLAERVRQGGFPVSPEARMRIRDTDTGKLVTQGVSGEIEMSGASRMAYYYGNPTATKKQILDDGYYRTGDMGYIASDGSLVFQARIEEVLRLSGYMVAVWEIESFVSRLAGVESCQVVGIHTKAGDRPVAFVVLRRGAQFDANAAKEECMRGLARFKVPIAFHVVDEFPMGKSLSAPKIDKKKLKVIATDLYEREQASAPNTS